MGMAGGLLRESGVSPSRKSLRVNRRDLKLRHASRERFCITIKV